MDLSNKILEAIEIMVNEIVQRLKLTSIIEGTIIEVIDANTYKVNLFDNVEILNSMNGHEYEVGDIVDVIVFNNNYSNKKILCKR